MFPIFQFLLHSLPFGMSTPSTEENYRALPLAKLRELEDMPFDNFGNLEKDDLEKLYKKIGLTLREKVAFRKVWSEHPKRRWSVFAPFQSSTYGAASLTAQAGVGGGGSAERYTKRRRVEDLQECNLRVVCRKRQVEDFAGEILDIEGLPNMITTRYSIPPDLSLYCRKCYISLYSCIKKVVLDGVTCPVMLIDGVPGIGKSLFSIYFMIRMMMDAEFPVKTCFVEYVAGEYHKCTLTECLIETATDPTADVKWTAALKLHIERCFEIDGSTDLILSDIKAMREPQWAGRWTCIFAPPEPERYKQTMKAPHNYRFKMPTWSQQELTLVNDRVDDWYDRFVRFGGVPRIVLWGRLGSDPGRSLDVILLSEGPAVIRNVLRHGFDCLRPDKDYMLVHFNPPWSQEENDWDYLGAAVHSFASDEIFKALARPYERELLSLAADVFNGGEPPESAGTVVAKAHR